MPANGKITSWLKPLPTLEASPQSQRFRSDHTEPRPSQASSALSDLPSTPTLNSDDVEYISRDAPALANAATAASHNGPLKKQAPVEIDDSEDDSDESLLDLDVYLKSKKQEAAVRAGMVQTKIRLRQVTKQSAYKFDIDSIVSRVEADEMSTAIANSMLEEIERQEGARKRQKLNANGYLGADDGVLAALVPEEMDDGVNRIKGALMRTDALKEKPVWNFFSAVGEPVKRRPYPAASKFLSDASLPDSEALQDAALSGRLSDHIYLSNKDPNETLLWLVEELCHESRDEICFVYRQAIQDMYDSWESITADEICNLFIQLGGSKEVIYVFDSLEPSLPVQEYDMRNFRHVLETLGACVNCLTYGAKITLAVMTSKVSIDSRVSGDYPTLQAMRRCFSEIVESFPETEWEAAELELCHTMYKPLRSAAIFQLPFISFIPAHTARAHVLRHRLAALFFLEKEELITTPRKGLLDIPAITARLGDKQFVINRDTDYMDLSARFSVLNILLDGGIDKSQASKDEEKVFNKQVDQLAAQVNHIASTIVDVGVSYMHRMEAKSNIERVYYRILFTVRTVEQPKRGIFGERKNRDMKEFLQK